MSSLRIAVAQYEPHVGDSEGNVALAVEWATKAADAGAQFVVLPELANSGYVFGDSDEADALAEDLSGEYLEQLVATSKAHDLQIVTGFNERGTGCRYNSSVCVDGSGVLATYRKLHLFYDEKSWFVPGDQLLVLDLPWGRLGMMICYDIWFPEVARALALAGADVLAMPTNWVSSFKRTVHDDRGFCQGDYVAMATAAQNGVVMACADRVGVERGVAFLGASIIVGADGWPIAGPASSRDPALLIADVDIESVARARARTPRNNLHDDRRPEAYNAVLVPPRAASPGAE